MFFEPVYDAGHVMNTTLLSKEVMQVGQKFEANLVMEAAFSVRVRVFGDTETVREGFVNEHTRSEFLPDCWKILLARIFRVFGCARRKGVGRFRWRRRSLEYQTKEQDP